MTTSVAIPSATIRMMWQHSTFLRRLSDYHADTSTDCALGLRRETGGFVVVGFYSAIIDDVEQIHTVLITIPLPLLLLLLFPTTASST